MIAFVVGMVDSLEEDAVLLEVAGIGYRIYMPIPSLQTLVVGQSIRLYTYQHVREDALMLYGFIKDEERKLFLRLQNANGVGAKLALTMMSHLRFGQLLVALRSGDTKALQQVPGIGAKTASRLVLEVKDRLDDLWLFAAKDEAMDETPFVVRSKEPLIPSGYDDLFAALISLGFSHKEISHAIALGEEHLAGKSVSEQIKFALRALER
jgi:Holliday junction DNA helicase RuvA